METKEFEQFKLLDENRDISSLQVSRLKESIKKHGFIKSKPILVNENFEIIDGQHRFLACKELDIAIEFCFLKGSNHDLIIDLNATQKSWSIKDYCKHYANKGSRNYVKILEVSKETGISENLAAFILAETETNLIKNIKSGAFTTNKTVFNAISLIKNIRQLCDITVGRETPKKIVRAVKNLQKLRINIEELVKRCKNVRDRLYPCTTMEGYMKMYIEAYNYNNRNKVKIVV